MTNCYLELDILQSIQLQELNTVMEDDHPTLCKLLTVVRDIDKEVDLASVTLKPQGILEIGASPEEAAYCRKNVPLP